MTVAIYARKSVERQDSVSIDTQIEECKTKVPNQLKAALSETDPKKQEENLKASNSGAYWDKFAAMSGKLYIAAHPNNIHGIYQNGPSELLSNILK